MIEFNAINLNLTGIIGYYQEINYDLYAVRNSKKNVAEKY